MRNCSAQTWSFPVAHSEKRLKSFKGWDYISSCAVISVKAKVNNKSKENNPIQNLRTLSVASTFFFLSPRAARLQRYFCLAGVFTLPQITNCLNNKCPEQWYDDSRLSSWFNVIAKIKQKEKSKCGGEMIDFIPWNLFHCIVKTNKFRSRRQA